jgi:hypothetical protein
MKKTILVSLTAILAVLLMSFTVTSENEGNAPNDDNTCTVTVKYSSGSLAKSVKVSTDVSGGISCVGGRSFYTDSDGKVTLEWSSGCYLKKVYVKGTGYDVDYKDGKTYTLTLK